MKESTLIRKALLAEGTMEFAFGRPPGFSYEAGQTIDLRLIDPPETDAEGNTRTFSLISAPHEPILRIATRMRGTTYKRVLGALFEGSRVAIDGPFGSFTLHENIARPAVFLAGGIGIAPFHSMAADAAHRQLPHRIALFYANRRPEDAAFLDDLAALAAENPNFSLVPAMTAMENSLRPWAGERGYVDAAMLARHVPQDTLPVYYLAGPQGMTLALRDMLKASGVSGDDIRYEEFAGY